MRHTSFRCTVEDPSAELAGVLARHAGAARYAFNACLGLVKQAVAAHRDDPGAPVPYSGFDLINAWNHFKTSPAAGVDEHGNVGLPWRAEVCQQVFEEAAVDLGRGLAAYTASKKGARKGRRVGFPAFKKRGRADESFRLRNKTSKTGRTSIRLGDTGPRTLNLPVIGTLALVEETRRLRRMLDKGRAKILFATVRKTGRGRWTVSLNVEAADLHPDRQHQSPTPVVGVDRGLSNYAVAATATGAEVARLTAPKPLAGAQRRLRRANKALHRNKPGSANRGHAKAVVARVHARVCAVRSDYLHRVTTDLAKTHSLVAVETLNIAGMLRNQPLAKAISDAAWGTFARLLGYKLGWRGGELILADRWFASSKTCSACGTVVDDLPLSQRVFTCPDPACLNRHGLCRDTNAAINLAVWASRQLATRAGEPTRPSPTSKAETRNARGGTSSTPPPPGGAPRPDEAGTGQTATAA